MLTPGARRAEVVKRSRTVSTFGGYLGIVWSCCLVHRFMLSSSSRPSIFYAFSSIMAAVAYELHARQAVEPAFDPHMFYRIRNFNMPNYQLGSGIAADTYIPIELNIKGGLSSENWQLFYQAGRYFIRNRDYGPEYQLGLTDGDTGVPRLYRQNGTADQQWTVNQVVGGYEMVNELVGSASPFALRATSPAMRAQGTGGWPNETIWIIDDNPRLI